MKRLTINSVLITSGAFLAYFVTSAVVSPLGIVSRPIAEQFQVSVSTATAAFTYLTTGIFAGTTAAVFVFDLVRLKHAILSGVIVICGAIATMHFTDSFSVVLACLFLLGACCGLEFSAGAVIIAKTFSDKWRASMLLLTDAFYSVAGVLSTSLAGYLLAREHGWPSAYYLGFVASCCIAAIAICARYPDSHSSDAAETAVTGVRDLPVGVHVTGLAMLTYLIGFVSIYSWVPNYAQESLGLTVQASGLVVSRLFLGMMAGQLLMFVLVFRFPLKPLIVGYLIAATGMTAVVWSVSSAGRLELSMLALGIITGGLFKILLTFGTTLVSKPSSKLVSYLVFYAGLGTAAAPFVSAQVVAYFGTLSSLQFASACYVVTTVLVLATREGRLKE